MKWLSGIIKIFDLIIIVIILSSCSLNNSQHAESKKVGIDSNVTDSIIYEMGTLNIDDQKELSLKLENLLQVPIVINDIKGFCSCTQTYYDKKPILPKRSSEIKIKFIPHQTGTFNKALKMYLSSQDNPVEIIFNGEIIN